MKYIFYVPLLLYKELKEFRIFQVVHFISPQTYIHTKKHRVLCVDRDIIAMRQEKNSSIETRSRAAAVMRT